MKYLYPDYRDKPDEDFSYGDLELPGSSALGEDLPFVFINMVSSLDGKVSVRGRSGAMGSDFDRTTMRQLRSLSDAVMVGSGTVRSERVSLTTEGRASREPLSIIVSSSLNLPLKENLLEKSRERTLLITTKGSVESSERKILAEIERYATIIECEPDIKEPGSVDLEEAMRFLRREYRVKRLLVEGGPGLNHRLISGGLVDEIFLTLSPKIISGRKEQSLNIVLGESMESACVAKLVSVQEANSELFLRYSLKKQRDS